MKLCPSSSSSSRQHPQDDLACEECGAHADLQAERPGERATAGDPDLHLAVRHLADLAQEHRTALDLLDERRASPRPAPVPSRASRRKVARGSSSLSAA
jgi:hypothetical protein